MGLTAFGGSVQATQCPDPDNDDEYVYCDKSVNEFEFYHRPNNDIVSGETGLMVGEKGIQHDHCNGCVYYYFDLAGLHEGFSKEYDGSTKDYVSSFGFRWETDNPVTPDPQPIDSNNIQSGVTAPDESASANDDEEDAWWALGDVLVAGGSVLYPKLGVPAFLYTVARASNLSEDIDDEVRFDAGAGGIDSGGFGYYNMRMQVSDDMCGTVKFEAFTEVAGQETTTTTKTFDLDRHTSGITCY